MTKFEFETFTHVEVSEDLYYKVIEPFYMSVEADKQTFCKMWIKMNANKVRVYKEWQKDKFTLFELASATYTNKPITAKMLAAANKWGFNFDYLCPSETVRRVNELDNRYNTIY